MRNFKTYIIIFCAITNISFAQLQGQARIDSMLKELPKAKLDTNHVMLLGNLSFEYYTINPDEGIKYGEKGLELAEKLGWNFGQATCFNALGVVFSYGKSNYLKALEYYQKALKISEAIGDRLGVGIQFGNIANLYQALSDYPKSLEYYNKALKIHEELGDKFGVSRNIGNIASLYSKTDITKSIEYYYKSLKIDKELGDQMGVAFNYSNLGLMYNNLSNFSKALDYFNNSLKIFEKVGSKYRIANTLGYMGRSYLLQTNDSIIEQSNNKNDLIMNKAYNINKAIEYFNKSINIYNEIGELKQQSYFLMQLSEAYSIKFDYKKAYETFKEYKTLQDSIFSMDKQKEIVNLESKRELEIKEKENLLLIKNNELFNSELIQKNQKINLAEKEKALQHLAFLKEQAEKQEKEKELSLSETQMKLQKSQIASLDKDKERQNAELKAKSLQRNFFIAGVIVFIILFLIAFIRFREKKKLSDKLAFQNAEVENQKNLVENQKNIVEEQKEILQEKNEQIYSSINYAATIQHAILPWDSIINSAFSNILIFYKPKDIVSGDSYWFKEIDGIKFLAVIDCTGHGIPGAMLTLIASNALDDAVLGKRLSDTAQILTYMNEKVTEVLNQRLVENKIRDGMEVALIAIHKDKIQFSGAGRPLYLKNGTMEIIKTDKRGIAGQTDNDEYQFSAFEIEKTENMMIYLTTDGFADQMNESSKKYSTKRLVSLLDTISDKPISDKQVILENEFSSHKGTRSQIDDVTILGVRV